MKAAYCLYRVSDHGQVEKNDIPMQRIACREFAKYHSWEIVKEFSEKGVSGYKQKMADRDAILQIREDALLGKFDVLLVFTFDRIGRRDDETPFVVEWLVRRGIAVWSVCEGEQRFDNHVDKLTNYIRYWQAAGESERISERTRTRIRQLTAEGFFTGGVCPYGYELARLSRENKKKQPLYDLVIHPTEAGNVRLMFDMVTREGYGVYRIANHLNANGVLPRSGKPWSPASLYGILRNPLYLGIVRRGDASAYQEHLQIIDEEQFSEAQEIRAGRAHGSTAERTIPVTQGASLLSGFLYCGHCGARVSSNHVTRHYVRQDGGVSVRRKRRYYCCRKIDGMDTECTGQHTYSAERVEAIVQHRLDEFWGRLSAVNPEDVAKQNYRVQLNALRQTKSVLESECAEQQKILTLLKCEVIRSLQGEPTYEHGLLNEMILQTQHSLDEIAMQLNEHGGKLLAAEKIKQEIEYKIGTYLSERESYLMSSLEGKKMILSRLIRSVQIERGYNILVDFLPAAMELIGEANP